MPLTPVHRRIVDHSAAWTNWSLGGVAALRVELRTEHLAAIDGLLNDIRRMPTQAVTRKHFDHPALNRLLANLFAEIQSGRGAVLVGGLSRARYSDEELERIYWGFCTHWGIAAAQSAFGDRLGRVRNTPVGPQNPTGRRYRSDEELRPHTDSFEIAGYFCLEKAVAGGASEIVSALAIHNEILRTRPDLLAPLYRGFPYSSSEAANSDRPLTMGAVPVFSYVGGQLSCRYVRSQMERAARKLAHVPGWGPMPDDLIEALDYFDSLSSREDLAVRFMLEPGEMYLVNNFTTLHARTRFIDGPRRKRQILRMWLEVPGGRRVMPEYTWQAQSYKRLGALRAS
jgi:hypothetical protein